MTCPKCNNGKIRQDPMVIHWDEGMLYEPMYLPPDKRLPWMNGRQFLPPLIERSQKEEHTPEPQWTKRQWDEVQQLKARVLHAEAKVEELRAKKVKKDRL